MGWIAPIAVAAKRRREAKEEEQMIEQLKRDDPEGHYEYKVLRSHNWAFRRREGLRGALDREALAGWELVAKLDDGRLMLRREVARRATDANLPSDVDPYRISVDSNLPLLAGVVAALLLVLVLGVRSLAGGTALGGVIGAAVVLLGLAALVGALALKGSR